MISFIAKMNFKVSLWLLGFKADQLSIRSMALSLLASLRVRSRASRSVEMRAWSISFTCTLSRRGRITSGEPILTFLSSNMTPESSLLTRKKVWAYWIVLTSLHLNTWARLSTRISPNKLKCGTQSIRLSAAYRTSFWWDMIRCTESSTTPTATSFSSPSTPAK